MLRKHPVGEIMKSNKQDLTMPVQPSVLFLNCGFSNLIIIRMNSGLPVQRALSKIEPVFKSSVGESGKKPANGVKYE